MNDNTAQKTSPAYRLAALDADFLLGDSMRGVRLQLEYEKAEERLRAWSVRSTIVVFGSACPAVVSVRTEWMVTGPSISPVWRALASSVSAAGLKRNESRP